MPTVASALRQAIGRTARMSAAPVLTCAGRTDAGVHARGQVVHVDLPPIPFDGLGLARALNRQLSPSIVVLDAVAVPDAFDARRSARARTYRYLVWNAPAPDPLLHPVTWHVRDPLDLRAMAAATDVLLGTHDFRSFCRRTPGTSSEEPNSFCHQMVRALVGSLVEVGRGRGNAATLLERLRATSRHRAADPAPAQGLCLVSVRYDEATPESSA